MSTLAVIWRGAGLLLATDTQHVIEVLPPVAWRPVPGIPSWVRGVFMYRGDLIPLIDSERLLYGLPNAQASPPVRDLLLNRVLVVRVAPRAAEPPKAVGLWVSSILELDRIDFAGRHTHPGFHSDTAGVLGPIAPTRWGTVQLVTPADLLTTEQAELIASRLSEAAA
jgi:chemotaxis-related protein WspB